MNRTNIYLTDEQRDQLDARARAEGMARAELIRQILDNALNGESDRLAADVAAIEGSFGVLDDEWTLDRGDGARGEHLDRVAGR